jgi:hypothetical protein
MNFDAIAPLHSPRVSVTMAAIVIDTRQEQRHA